MAAPEDHISPLSLPHVQNNAPSLPAGWLLDPDINSDALGDAEIQELENSGAFSVTRQTDRGEAASDERQERTTSVNFPLHWTSSALSWNYLFDFAIACQLLGPRPDDLVLDFASGTGWASELLARLGVRTISTDLSLEMLRRSRTRWSADSRLEFREHAHFVAARGQALPFADGVFDGVVCLNALHHLPSFRVGLEEIHRVLKDGGRAAFSEPGLSHAAQPLSQFRMREEHVLEKSVSLPLIHKLAQAVGFTRMEVVPLRSASEYLVDYTKLSLQPQLLDSVWADTLAHYPKEHARFVLCKGGERAADTLLPPQQLTGRLKAQIELVSTSPTAHRGQSFVDQVRVVNEGTVTWKAKGRRFGGHVTCGMKLCDLSGNVIREDLGRTPLPYDVAPGDVVAIDIHVEGIDPAGHYLLRYDMVVEGVTWFELQGSRCQERRLHVLGT
jgi:ubiquinone/menaquinone biosynthesis C-methylase UbiE